MTSIDQLIEQISARILRRYQTEHTGVSIQEIVRWTVEALGADALPGGDVIEAALKRLDCACVRTLHDCIIIAAHCPAMRCPCSRYHPPSTGNATIVGACPTP